RAAMRDSGIQRPPYEPKYGPVALRSEAPPCRNASATFSCELAVDASTISLTVLFSWELGISRSHRTATSRVCCCPGPRRESGLSQVLTAIAAAPAALNSLIRSRGVESLT